MSTLVAVIVVLLGLVPFADTKVQWSVEHKINRYGENLKLVCKVENCCSKNVTKRWFGGPDQKPLWLSMHESNKEKYENEKYVFLIEKSGFGLVIKTLSISDVNVTYQCSYGFTSSDSKLLTESDVFIDEDEGRMNETTRKDESAKEFHIEKTGLILLVTLLILLCGMIVLMIILYRLGKLRRIIAVFMKRKDETITEHATNQEKEIFLTTVNDTKTGQEDEDNLEKIILSSTTIPDKAQDNDIGSTSNAREPVLSGVPVMENGYNFEEVTSQNGNTRNTPTTTVDRRPGKGHASNNGTNQKPKYPAYKSKEFRAKSFTHPQNVKLPPEILAKAGFFSYGESDIMRCFYCGGALQNLEEKDSPWELHARWFPSCLYLLEKMGEEFVKQIQTKCLQEVQTH